MNKFNNSISNFNFLDDDSVDDVDTFNLKYNSKLFLCNSENNQPNVIQKYKNFTNYSLSDNTLVNNFNFTEKVLNFDFEEKSNQLIHNKIKRIAKLNDNNNEKRQFSLRLYLKRIIGIMFTKPQLKNVRQNF